MHICMARFQYVSLSKVSPVPTQGLNLVTTVEATIMELGNVRLKAGIKRTYTKITKELDMILFQSFFGY